MELRQEHFDALYREVMAACGPLPAMRSPCSHSLAHVPTERLLQRIDDLTTDRPWQRSLVPGEDHAAAFEPVDDFVEEDFATSSTIPASFTVPQQLLPYVVKYGFEACRSVYFEFVAELTAKSPYSPSKSQKGLSCDFFPDYKCKQSPLPVITTCRKVPACSLCARCGSLGDHTMVHCLGCCDTFHYFCTHLPERLVTKLTSWFCHRCAVCAVCMGKETTGKKFVADIMDTCFRCQLQYHVNCRRINNFNLIHRDTSKEMKVCNACLFQSHCKRCRCTIPPEGVYQECCEVSSQVCVECRNSEERDLCRPCGADLKISLRKVTCDNCKDIYHVDCLCDTDRPRADTLPFLCCDCLIQLSPSCTQPASTVIRPPEVWTAKTGRQLLRLLRGEILQHMNSALNRSDRSSRRSESPRKYSPTKAPPADSVQLPPTEVEKAAKRNGVVKRRISVGGGSDQAVPSCSSGDLGFVRRDDGLEQDLFEALARTGGGHTNADDVVVDQASQMSPDSGIVVCDTAGPTGACSSFDSMRQTNAPQKPLAPSSEAAWFYTKSGGIPQTLPALSFGPPGSFMDDPVFWCDKFAVFQQNIAASGDSDRRSNISEQILHESAPTALYTSLLKAVDDVCDSICLDPWKLQAYMGEVIAAAGFSPLFIQNIDTRFAEFCSKIVLPPDGQTQTKDAIRRTSIFPVLRRGSEPPPTVSLQPRWAQQGSLPASNANKIFRITDLRVCLFCSAAGDDSNSAGRLLSVGYDVFAHIGCLTFASTKKRVYDYVVLKLSHLESPQFRRNECAVCPLPLAVIGCAEKRCRNSYHINCAALEECSFASCLLTELPGVVCPVHRHENVEKEACIRIVRAVDLDRSFREMPVFARSPPTNIQAFGNPAWSTGVRKEDVKVHLGAAYIEQLGRLVRGWETKDCLLPCGYKMHRVFWSSVAPQRLTRYTFLTLDLNMHPEVKALICAILRMEDIPALEYIKQRKAARLNAVPLPEVAIFGELWGPTDIDDGSPPQPESSRQTDDMKMAALGDVICLPTGPADEEDDFVRDTPSAASVEFPVTAPLFADEDSKVLAIAAEEAAFATRPPAVTVPPAQLPAVDAGDTRPRSARSRSSSPEIPMTAAPVLPHPPAKRARSPSLSPIIEVKRRLLFPANPMPKKESYVPLPPAKKSQRQSSVGTSDEGDSSATTVSSRGSIPPGSPDLWDSAVEMSLSGVFPVLGRRTTRASVCRSSPAPLDAVQRATARRSSRSQTCERKRSENQSAVVLSSGPKKRSGLRVVEATVVKNLVSNGRSKPTWPEVRVSGSRRAQAVAPSTSKKTKVADVSQDVEAVEVAVAKRCGRNNGTSGKKKGRSGKKQSKAVVLDLPESPDSAAFSVISSVSFLSGTPLDDNPLHVVASTPSPSARKSARLLLSCSPEVPFYPDVPAPTGPRSCLRNTETMHDGTYRRSPRKVKISGKIDHRFFEPEYNVLPPYISDSSIEPDPGPYFVDPQDLDLEPDYFGTVKFRARLEMSVFRKNQVDELMSMLKTTETSLVSKQPAQLCLLVGQDGFFAASHWPEELVSHLFTNIQRSRRAHGLNSSHPGGIPIGLTPGEFVGLTFPVVRFLLEQLQPPVNSASVYSRSFFPKEALKGRLKVDLPQSEQSFPSRREASCVTCSLPSHCFTVSNGRTYTRVPVMERQVVLKWSAPYRVVPDVKTASPKWIRVFNSSYVDPGSFPDYYDDIRHDKKQTFVLSYALHPSQQVVSLALIAKKNFAPGTEVRFDPGRDVYRVDEALGVKDFSCARHGRSF